LQRSFPVAAPLAPLFAFCCTLTCCTLTSRPVWADNWPQPAGPHGNWITTGRPAPDHWSVTLNRNILWRTTLPEEGQSGIAVWGDRLFLTTMKPLAPDATKKEGADIVGYCLDAHNGKVLWTVDLPGSVESTYAYGFSDSTTPSPVTDGKYVWFTNCSGSLGCYDYQGKRIWLRRWQPTSGRPFNKQFEPILYGNTLINLEPRDIDDPRREKDDPWNYLRGIAKHTGKTLWVSEDSLTHYNTPLFGTLADGTPAILQGRGGYHDVPETPIGLTLTSLAPGQEGKAIWRYTTTGKALYTMHWDRQYAYWFDLDASEHQVIDVNTGKRIKTQSLLHRVDYRRYDPQTGKYVLLKDIDLQRLDPPQRVFPAWFCNVVTEGYHYFLCFTDAGQHYGPPHCIGRVNIKTDKVEYLELPVQVVRTPGETERVIWGQAQSSSTVNSRGIDVAGDDRSKRDGWFWCMLGSPTVVNGKLFITTMLGVTYVINARAITLDERALLAVNDLGPAGQTWSLNSISYANGHLYHRSLKEVVCIGEKKEQTRRAK
jgi:outer membrane protein assembly factor BamB